MPTVGDVLCSHLCGVVVGESYNVWKIHEALLSLFAQDHREISP